ncbi:hypothetical protein [Maribacter hydrothermalis]|uniref:Uncharacterized protein n=1 Tax=Maribacter hydrothermalis TaxID=1836467 RepID=A0A1B7ZD30_9FLAO|nr:hypothetical protein [Maribacter hydrothermalis]APQ18793.1 hypothetical protein BTR34_16370 [Maribacter hydrothermalis]OBR41037.1 hypothetical protein A9200_14545 [Maribacter hydrothermalis]
MNREGVLYKYWKLVAVINLILVVRLILGLSKKNEKRLFMVWKVDHYEKTDCAVSYKVNILPLYEVRLENFKKIDVDLTTDFFE